MPNVDWDKIKAEYLQGGTSYRKLADKHGVSYSTLRDRAVKEEWTKLRDDVRNKAGTKAVQKIVSQRAKDIEALDRTRSLLIAHLEKSVSKFPDIPGNRMEQTVSDLIPPKGEEETGKRKATKVKTVKFESDLLKMVSALDKLMELTGYSITVDDQVDDGFLEALNNQSAEVMDDESDTPEDLD